MVRPALIAALAGGLCLRSPPLGAAAQPPPDVVDLQIRDCDAPAFSVRDMYQAVTLELMLDGARRVMQASGPATGGEDLSVAIVCAADLQATVVLTSPRGTLALSRHVPLAETEARDRARVLALAVADWVRVAWPQVAGSAAEQTARPRAGPVSILLAPAPAGTIAARPPEPGPAFAVSVTAEGRARWFALQRTLAWGGSVGLDLGRAGLRLEALTSRRDTSLGAASVGLAAAGISYALWRRQTAATRLSVGPGVAIGVTWAAAQGARETVVIRNDAGLYADARLALAGAIAVRPLLWLVATLEGGRAAGLAELAGAQPAGATGGWFGGGGIGAAF